MTEAESLDVLGQYRISDELAEMLAEGRRIVAAYPAETKHIFDLIQDLPNVPEAERPEAVANINKLFDDIKS